MYVSHILDILEKQDNVKPRPPSSAVALASERGQGVGTGCSWR